jgi:hypothetical protein
MPSFKLLPKRSIPNIDPLILLAPVGTGPEHRKALLSAYSIERDWFYVAFYVTSKFSGGIYCHVICGLVSRNGCPCLKVYPDPALRGKSVKTDSERA